MHLVLLALAAALAAAIIVIGLMYLFIPAVAMRSFGLPLPDGGATSAAWLRLKGVRDIATGLTVLALMVWGGPRIVGIALLVKTLIPLGDGGVILASRGSVRHALGVHGVTALVMLLTSVPLVLGA